MLKNNQELCHLEEYLHMDRSKAKYCITACTQIVRTYEQGVMWINLMWNVCMEKVSILVTDLVLLISVGSLDLYIPAGLTVYLGAGLLNLSFSVFLFLFT